MKNDVEMVDVQWLVNNQVKETLAYNVPRPIGNYLRIQARNSTHKTGVIRLKKHQNTLTSRSVRTSA